MTRPTSILLAVATTVLALSGCGSAQSNSSVASVDDTVLTTDHLKAIMDADATANSIPPTTTQPGEPSAGGPQIPRAEATAAIQFWVWNELLRAELVDLGAEVPEPIAGDTTEVLRQNAEAAYNSLAALDQSTPPSEQDLQERFDLQVCIGAAQVPGQDEANSLVEAVNDGGDFSSLAPQVAGENTGLLGCVPAEVVAESVSGSLGQPELAGPLTDFAELKPGQALDPIETEGGYWVFQRPDLEELLQLEPTALGQPSVLISLSYTHHDVKVDSMYGEFGPAGLLPPS